MSSPEIQIATYSNIEVYECFVNDTLLMRRVHDDWVNATQILKAAKYPKAHRTRILEKEVQHGVHEKIQGGYGRFQGTWIPLEMARPFAHRYDITDEMAPILVYQPDPNKPLKRKEKSKTQLPSADTTSETTLGKKPRKVYNTKKRRAAAAAAAQEAAGSNIAPRSADQPQVAQHVQSMPNEYWHNGIQGYPPNSAPAQLSHLHTQLQMPQFKGNSSQGPYQQLPLASHPGFSQPIAQSFPVYQPLPGPPHSAPSQQSLPPTQPQLQNFHNQQQQPYQHHKSKGSQENWSQDDASQMDDVMRDSDTSVSSEHSEYDHANKLTKHTYADALIDFFSNETALIPEVLRHPPTDFDPNDPIDDEDHTPLHWASSMASIPLVELLLKNGADPLVPNSNGLNCISRSIFFNNSFQKQNFHQLVDAMKNCLYTPDKQGRTPLHYLAAANSSKAQIARYYTECILDRLSQENSNLLKVVLNHKDLKSDTAFDLAKKTNNQVVLDVLKRFLSSLEQNGTDTNGHAMKEIDVHDATSGQDSEPLQVPSVPSLPLKEVGPILTSMLSSLADAYDTELKNKEEEGKHTEEMLTKLEADIKETEMKNNLILSQLENGHSTYEELQSKFHELEESCAKKSDHLNLILERSQSLKVAKLVLSEENKIDPNNSSQDDDLTKWKLACDLTKLQLKRNKTIDRIIEQLTTSNINEKMNKYRRLIAVSCTLKAENIDELIDEIEADLLTTVSTIE